MYVVCMLPACDAKIMPIPLDDENGTLHPKITYTQTPNRLTALEKVEGSHVAILDYPAKILAWN